MNGGNGARGARRPSPGRRSAGTAGRRTRRAAFGLCLALAGCPKEELRHTLTVVETPKAEAPPAPPPAPDPLPSWRAGWTSAAAMTTKPEVGWGFTLGGPITTPILADADQVYAVADGRLHAFSADGKRLWETRLPGCSGAALAGDTLVAGAADGRIRFVNRVDGTVKSSTPEGAAVVGAPVPIDGGWAWATADGGVSTTAGWSQATGHHPAGRAAADGSTVFVASVDGVLVAVAASGVLWTAQLPAGAVDGPALDAENVYVSYTASGGNPGGVVAFARTGADAGKERWRFHGGFQPLGAPGVTTRVYVPEKDGSVYAVNPSTGNGLWTAEGYGEFTTQPLVANGSIYVGNSDGHLSRIDPDDGGVAWQVDLGGPVSGEPAIVGKRMVIGLATGRLVEVE